MAVKEQIDELTGLRGVAALAIMLNHVLLLLPHLGSTLAVYILGPMGNIGMSLFFTLSGVVIYYNYFDRICESPARQGTVFFVHRFARLYPMYFIFVIGCFLYYTINTSDDDIITSNIATLPIFLTCMQTWTYGFVGSREILYWQENANITWSISTEFFFYVAFVVLIFYFNRMKKYALISLFIIILLRFIYAYFVLSDDFSIFIKNAYADHSGGVLGGYEFYWIYFIYHAPYFRIFEFLAGCSIASYIMSDTKNIFWEKYCGILAGGADV